MRSSLGLAALSVAIVSMGVGCGILKNKNLPVPEVIQEKGPEPVTQSYVPRQGADIAKGWQLMTDLQTSESCISYNSVTVPLQYESLHMQRVLDKENVTKALNLSSSQVFADEPSKSTLIDFVMNSQLLALGTHVVGQATVKTSAEVALPVGQQQASKEIVKAVKHGEYDVKLAEKDDSPTVQLSNKYLALLKRNPKAFYESCGDTFVSSIQHGAQANMLFNFDTKTVSDRDALVRSLASTAGSRLFSEGFNTVLGDYEAKEGVSIQYQGAASNGIPVKAESSESVKELLAGLSDTAVQESQPILVTLQRYDSLENWPGDIVLPVNDEGVKNLAIDFVRLESLHEAISHIIDFPDAYVTNSSEDHDRVKLRRDDLKNKIEALKQVAISCISSLGKDCSTDIANSDYDYRLGLPVPAGSFAEDVERQHLEGLIAKSKEQKQQLAAQYLSRQEQGVNIARKRKYQGIRIANNVFNPQIERAQRELSDLKDGAWGQQMIETKLNWWVSEIARERCKLGYSESCFTKEQEDVFKSQIALAKIDAPKAKEPAADAGAKESVTSALLKSLEAQELSYEE